MSVQFKDSSPNPVDEAAVLPGPAPAARPTLLGLRLSVLMFLAYAILGSWLPVFSVYLHNLHFSPHQIAWAYATSSLGALVTPLLWGQIADRWLATERCLALCAGVVGLILGGLVWITTPGTVILLNLLFWLFMTPVMSLTTALTFRQLHHPEREFGKVRAWGTIGWVAASLLLSFWLASLKPWLAGGTVSPADLADSLMLGGGFALLLSLYAWTLPHTPPLPRTSPATARRRWLRVFDAPLTAMELLRDRAFVVYCICLFGLYLTFPFSTQMGPLLLRQLGIDPGTLPLALTISQSTEVVALLGLPWILGRLGQKKTMLVGISAWVVGLTIFCIGRPVPLVLAGQLTHGLFICCFFVAGQVFVNRRANDSIRASTQGLILLISGVGLLGGNLFVGLMRQLTADDFRLAYLPAVVMAAGLLLLFRFGFTLSAPAKTEPAESLVPGQSVT